MFPETTTRALIEALPFGVKPIQLYTDADTGKERGAFTIFSIVDAVTRMTGKLPDAG